MVASRGINASRIFSGTFMTSLDGPGFSITLLKANQEILECIDAPVIASGWTVPSISPESWERGSPGMTESGNVLTENEIEVGGKLQRKFKLQ
jgi:hypothetical protein